MKATVFYRDHNPGWFSQPSPARLYSDPPELSSQVSMGTSIYIHSLPPHLLTAIEHIFTYDCVCYMYTVVFLKGTFRRIKPASNHSSLTWLCLTWILSFSEFYLQTKIKQRKSSSACSVYLVLDSLSTRAANKMCKDIHRQRHSVGTPRSQLLLRPHNQKKKKNPIKCKLICHFSVKLQPCFFTYS